MAHIISRKTYAWTWLALLLLLLGTWAVSRVDLSPLNTAIALAIAVVKMMLIILYFMHIRFSRRLMWIFVATGFFWLLILLELTLTDYLTRGSSWSQ